MVAMAFEGQKNIGGQNGNNSRLGSQLRFGGQKFTSGKVWDIVSGACGRLGGLLWALLARGAKKKRKKTSADRRGNKQSHLDPDMAKEE